MKKVKNADVQYCTDHSRIAELSDPDGRYRIDGTIGSGGNADVYLVYDKKLDKNWALKVQSALSENELNILKTVSHPAFPRIVDTLEGEGCVGLLMDYIPGKTLDKIHADSGISFKELYEYAIELADALAYLHDMDHPILYLDCKPGNIILGDDGHIHLIDLGSAYIIGYGGSQRISGTLPYAAPEQRTGLHVDERSDIYAFGMTLYALTDAPNKDIGLTKRLERHIRPHRDMISLTRIIRRCLQHDPAARYQSVHEVLRHLHDPRLIGYTDLSFHNILNKSGGLLYKMIAALFCVISFDVYENNMQTPYLILGAALFCLLTALCLRGCNVYGVQRWTCKKDVFLGNMSAIIISLLICILLFSGKSHASEYEAEAAETVNIYDTEGSLVLYNGQYIKKDGDNLYLYIPTDSISADHIPARIEVVLR